MHDYIGRCPCGTLQLSLRSALAPGQFQPRSDAATCEVCRKYDGVWISDPAGTLSVRSSVEAQIRRFASGQVQFHFCPSCASLVYATFEDAPSRRCVAVMRLAVFEPIRSAALPTVVTNFDGETLEAGRQRRLERWTPVLR
jgi:hypothetical protein